MPNGDPMITPRNVQLPSMPTDVTKNTINQPQKKSGGGFMKVIGGIAGAALNLVAPGVGSLIGGAISGGSGSDFGSQSALYEQQAQFEKQQAYTQQANAMQMQQNQAMTAQQQKHSYQLIEVQNKVSMQAQEFSTVSNLMKSRHDSEMTAVNNIKS